MAKVSPRYIASCSTHKKINLKITIFFEDKSRKKGVWKEKSKETFFLKMKRTTILYWIKEKEKCWITKGKRIILTNQEIYSKCFLLITQEIQLF